MNDYFSDRELRCSCCQEIKFNQRTRDKLNALREHVGFPIRINSGYRCEAHNREIGATQTHATGQAVDIAVSHAQCFELIRLAPQYGFTGIGIRQKGNVNSRFIHLDDLDEDLPNRPRPHVWSY